jgi:hypothetical protein
MRADDIGLMHMHESLVMRAVGPGCIEAWLSIKHAKFLIDNFQPSF